MIATPTDKMFLNVYFQDYFSVKRLKWTSHNHLLPTIRLPRLDRILTAFWYHHYVDAISKLAISQHQERFEANVVLSYCLPEFTEGIGSTGSSVALGHNTTVSPSRVNVGGAGVVGADGAVYASFSTWNRSCSFPSKISTLYGPDEKASPMLKP